MLALPAEIRLVAWSAFAVSLPLAFAVTIVRQRKQPIAKSSLREPLYTFCYCTAPVFLAATPLWTIWLAQLQGLYPEAMETLASVYASVLMIWIVWIGAFLLRLHLDIGWGRALALVAKTYFVLLGLMMLLELGIIIILGMMILERH
jgi:hypothetical protein